MLSFTNPAVVATRDEAEVNLSAIRKQSAVDEHSFGQIEAQPLRIGLRYPSPASAMHFRPPGQAKVGMITTAPKLLSSQMSARQKTRALAPLGPQCAVVQTEHLGSCPSAQLDELVQVPEKATVRIFNPKVYLEFYAHLK